jgi:hypothetical protein
MLQLTWADFVFTGIYDVLKMGLAMPDLESKYPILKKAVDNVLSLPQLKTYLANRPHSDF